MKRFGPLIRKSLVVLVSLVVLLVLVAWLSGFFVPKITPGKVDAAVSSPADVQAVPVEVRQVPQIVQGLGTIRAVHEMAVGSRLLARIRDVLVTAGEHVRADQVLVELDQADILARMNQAQAAVDAAQARLAQAASDLSKIQQLLAQGAATTRELDDRQRAADVAKADLAASQQALAESQAQLSYATIRSPIDGVVIEKLVQAGDLAKPGQNLITLYDPKALQLVAPVPESVAVGLKVGDKVGVRIDALDKQCQAQISEIVPQASPGSRSFEVKVTGPCPAGVYSGMFGRLLIPQGTRQQLLVPAAAVRRIGQLEIVQVVEPGPPARLQDRYVTTGERAGDMVEVLSGLSPDEQVAIYQ
jgi:RND family efflux transporter MFP subunit